MIAPAIGGLRAQFYDDFGLGYERLVAKDLRVSVQGVYRTLREAIEDMWVPSDGRWDFGNPGRGAFSAYPRPQRDYSAITITIERRDALNISILLLHMYCRELYGIMAGFLMPILTPALQTILLPLTTRTVPGSMQPVFFPNDRTHVFKLSGSYRFL